MITIKLPYKTNNSDIEIITQYQKDYSALLRSVYNQKLNGKTGIEIRKYLKTLNRLNNLNCWFGESAVFETKCLINSNIARNKTNKIKDLNETNQNNTSKIIFGSKKQFIRRCKGLITNEEYKKSRLSNIYSVGQANQKGNRLFQLNIINDNQIIFKPNQNTKVCLLLPNLKSNIKKQLSKLEEKAKNYEIPYTVKFNKTHIYISFEEFKNDKIDNNLKERFLSLDLNPNHIGLSISEYVDNEYHILHTSHYDLTELIKNNDTNKIKFETLELSKTIINICKSFKCKYLFVEDLNMIGKNHNKGKKLNKLINNSWFRNLIVNNLSKRCNINNIKCYRINAAYTSYIGNLQNNYSDPVNASIEVGRRSYEIFVLKNKDNFYPELRIKDSILHQWKEMDIDRFKTWKELCLEIKNSKMRYRVSLDEASALHKVFRQEYNKPRGLYRFMFV